MTGEETFGNKIGTMRREVLAAGYESLIYKDFQSALPMLRNTELYRIFKEMPKGWLCHAHFEASFNPDYMLDMVMASDDAYISSSADRFGRKIAYRQSFEGCKPPEGWLRLKDAVASEPDLRNEIRHSLSTTLADLTPDIWVRFENIFNILQGINCYRPHLIKLITNAFEKMAEEGIQGVDFRFICQAAFDESGRKYTPEETIALYFEAERNVRQKYPWFTIRFVYCSHKGIELEELREELEFAKHLSDCFPGRMTGFDMVSFEDCGRSLDYYASVLEAGGLPIIMHAGESTDPGNVNMIHAMQMGINRIGHGLNSYRFPSVLKTLKERSVMLEVCPLSNQLLGYVTDLRQHPAKDYIKSGLNVTISSDDCGLFGADYITDDLLLAYLCWDLTLPELKRCLTDSLSVTDEAHTELFNRLWDNFIAEHA